MVTVLRSHGLSIAPQQSGLSFSVPPSRATLAEKAAVVANTRRDADATAATTKTVAAVINPDATVAITTAAALAAAARAMARGAAARDAASPPRPGATAAAAVPTRAAAAPTAPAVAAAAPQMTYSRNVSSGVGSVGAPGLVPGRLTLRRVDSSSPEPDGLVPQRLILRTVDAPSGTSADPDGLVPRQLILRRVDAPSAERRVGAPSAEPDGFVPRRLLVRACSFEKKVGQQRRGDGSSMLQRSVSFGHKSSSMLQRSVSFGRKAPRSSGSDEGALQLVPSVRHCPCYTPDRAAAYNPISCRWWTALPPQPCHTTQPPRHRSHRF